MPDDIVTRLRRGCNFTGQGTLDEAAGEIERLRQRITDLERQLHNANAGIRELIRQQQAIGKRLATELERNNTVTQAHLQRRCDD